ncbi:MAG: hypothetical protein IJ593_08790, partial [Lachnospiraceae bacterium]|nr:hypothetical protein [Lachnospiraceae bacterium]
TDYHTAYIPIADISVYEDGVLVELNEVNMREACDITIGKLTRSWYSREYEEGEFSEFWTKCFVVEHIEELKRLQNRFYWQAYGSDAFSKLTGMMGEYYTKLKDWQKQVLKGVVFSVMEARYRDKNIQGKMNLRLRAEEGELWPFLVNLNNLDKIERKTLSGGGYKYVDNTKKNEYGEADTYYDFPDFDTLIDGVYQWMYYYDSMTNSTSEGHRTVTNFINDAEDDEDEIEVDWEAEYYSLTDGDLNLTGAELTDFYTRCQKVRSLFKKSKENTEGIFG